MKPSLKIAIPILGILIVIGFCSLLYPGDTNKENRPEQRPNIILFSIDTLRADHLSCYGYNKPTSPFIDQFAKDSVLFSRAISQAPTTATSHMSIFTALTPAVHGIKNIRPDGTYRPLDESIVTLAEVLKDTGYLTIGIHGGAQVDGSIGFAQGFDEYSDDFLIWVTPRGLPKASPEGFEPIKKDIERWLRSIKEKKQPLFLFLHHYLCHDPYLKGPQSFRIRFLSERAAGLPVTWENISLGECFKDARSSFWKNVDLSNPQHLKHITALYDGGVYYSDCIFNEVMNLLKEKNLYDNSLIIFLSDHGEEFYEHGDKLHWRLFIETLHVPLIIKFPGNKLEGKIIRETVRSMDLMPTILDFLNIPVRHTIQGESFLPIITNQGGYNPPIVSYSEHDDSFRFVKDGYVYSNQLSLGCREWLFSQKEDPKEQNNLSREKPELIKRMRNEAQNILQTDAAFLKTMEVGKGDLLEANKELRKQLRALGYVP